MNSPRPSYTIHLLACCAFTLSSTPLPSILICSLKASRFIHLHFSWSCCPLEIPQPLRYLWTLLLMLDQKASICKFTANPFNLSVSWQPGGEAFKMCGVVTCFQFFSPRLRKDASRGLGSKTDLISEERQSCSCCCNTFCTH